MIQCFLTKIKTHDGVVLDGIVVLPKKKSRTALIWLHGLGSRFSSGQTLIEKLSYACVKNHIGYFKFNTRGHDIVSRDKNFIGAGFEKFGDCIYDIRAMILYAKKLGFTKIILAGHSTGANKSLFYMYKTRDLAVKGLALLGPLSDVSIGLKIFGEKKLRHALAVAKRFKNKKGALMPYKYGFWTPKRFLSLNLAGSAEDVFPYHNPDRQWKELKSISVPLAVIIGARDEYRDCSAKNLINGFQKKEKELSDALINWIKNINHGL